MKTLIIIFVFLFINSLLIAQCKQQLVYSCASQASEIYLCDFNTKIEKGEIKKYDFTLKKGNVYLLSICSDEKNEINVEMNLYNSKDSLLVSTTQNINFESVFLYTCKISDNYYITMKIKDKCNISKINAVCVLSYFCKDK